MTQFLDKPSDGSGFATPMARKAAEELQEDEEFWTKAQEEGSFFQMSCLIKAGTFEGPICLRKGFPILTLAGKRSIKISSACSEAKTLTGFGRPWPSRTLVEVHEVGVSDHPKNSFTFWPQKSDDIGYIWILVIN